MSGTKGGGRKAAITNKERHGKDFYRETGRLGGIASAMQGPKGFAAMPKDKVREAGSRGGKSRHGLSRV